MTITNINLNNVDSTMIFKMNKMILLSLFKEIIYLWEVTEGDAVLIEVNEVEMEINWIQIISTIKLQNNAAGGTIKMNEFEVNKYLYIDCLFKNIRFFLLKLDLSLE